MSQEELQEQLRKAGYGNVPTNIVQEFSQFLQTESDISLPNTAQSSGRSGPKKHRKGKKAAASKKRAKTPGKNIDSNTNNAQCQLSIPVDCEQEEDLWISKIQQLQQKANKIDLQLQACCEICSDDGRFSASPLYFFNYENYKDPYVKIKKFEGGRGFISPPPYRANRHRYPIYKNEVYGRPPDFIYELRRSERKPRPYIPGVEQRGYDMRFRIREKLQYTHPDFNI